MSTQASTLVLAQQTYDSIAKWDGGANLPSFQEQLDALNASIATLNAAVTAAQAQVTSAQQLATALQGKIDDAKVDIDSALTKLA